MPGQEPVLGLSAVVNGTAAPAGNFSMDLDNQMTQIQKLEMLEAETLKNNQELQRIAEEMLRTALKGRMANAFAEHFREILRVCFETNEKLGNTNTSLRKGTARLAGVDADRAAEFVNGVMNDVLDEGVPLNPDTVNTVYNYFNELRT